MILAIFLFLSAQARLEIPLRLAPNNVEGASYFAACSLGGQKGECLVDTGAQVSSFPFSGATKELKSLGQVPATSASGKTSSCDVVSIPRLGFGALDIYQILSARCPAIEQALIGANVFMLMKRVSFDFIANKIVLGPGSLSRSPSRSFVMRAEPLEHIILPIQLGEVAVDAVWDTGNNITAVAEDFIFANKDLFTPANIPATRILGANGDSIEATFYRVRRLKVGSLILKNTLVSAAPVDLFRGAYGPNLQVILGSNAMAKTVWHLDFESQRFGVSLK